MMMDADELDGDTAPFPEEVESEIADVDHAYLLAETLAVVRNLIVQGNADLVPELVQGETLAEVLASVEPAREAFRRIQERVKVETVAPVVPAGGVTTPVIDGPGEVLIKRAIVRSRGGE